MHLPDLRSVPQEVPEWRPLRVSNSFDASCYLFLKFIYTQILPIAGPVATNSVRLESRLDIGSHSGPSI